MGGGVNRSNNTLNTLDLQLFSSVSNPYTFTLDGNYSVSANIEQDLVDLSYYARKYIPDYKNIKEIPQDHLDYLQSGLHASNMHGIFYNCNRLTSIPKIDIDTSKVTDMGSMFAECWSIQSFEFLIYLNTVNVQNMSNMFSGWRSYSGTTILNLSNFNTSKVTDMSHMFDSSPFLSSIDLTNWDTSKVTDMSWMFHYCSRLSDVKGTLDMRSCTNIEHMFDLCSSNAHIHLKNVPKNLDFSSGVGGTEGNQYIIENYLD